MSLQNDMAALAKVQFFEGFTIDQLRLLAFGAEACTLFAGETLFLENDKSDCGFVLVEGLIDLTTSLHDGERIISSIEPGGLVGELALISETLRSTNAIARRNSRLLQIPRVLFVRMLKKYPETARGLYQKISRSVRSTMLEMEKIRTDLSDKRLDLT